MAILVATSVTLWVLQKTLLLLLYLFGAAYGSLTWANGVCFGAVIVFVEAHNAYKAGRELGDGLKGIRSMVSDERVVPHERESEPPKR